MIPTLNLSRARRLILMGCFMLLCLVVSAVLAAGVPFYVIEVITPTMPDEYSQIYRMDMSADGRYMVFQTESVFGQFDATGLLLLDRASDTTTNLISEQLPDFTIGYYPSLSENGRYAAFSGVADEYVYGYIYDIKADTYLNVMKGLNDEPLEVHPDYDGAIVYISPDGRYVLYTATAYNPFDNQNAWCKHFDPEISDLMPCYAIFMYDQKTGQTQRVSVNSAGELANNHSTFGAISADGRYIFFDSEATNLTSLNVTCSDVEYACTHLYKRDLQTQQTTLVSKNTMGVPYDRGATLNYGGHLSFDARYLLFASLSTNILTGSIEEDNYTNVFLLDTVTGEAVLLDAANSGYQACQFWRAITPIDLSVDGRFALFQQSIQNEGSSCTDVVFMFDRLNATTSLVSVNLEGGIAGVQSFLSSRVSGAGDQIMYEYAYDPIAKVYISAPQTITLARPANLAAVANSGTQIALTWQSGGASGIEYRIERSLNGLTEWAQIGTVNTATTAYLDSGLACETPYYYRVRAAQADGSAFSPYSFTAEATTLLCPVTTQSPTSTATNTPHATQTATETVTAAATSTGTITATDTPNATTSATNAATATATVCAPIELLKDGGFGQMDDWQGQNLDNDKQVTNKPDKTVAHSGEAAFQFRATPGVTSKLAQGVTLLSGECGDTLVFSAWAQGKNLDGASVQAKLTYNDGNKAKLKLDSTALNAGTYAYMLLQAPSIAAADVSEAKVQIRMKGGTGRLRIDDVSLMLITGAAAALPTGTPSVGEVLPLP